ncbi:MAG: TetR/AcrR family transcriptional regulator [Cytophagales bacterium]|nr:MAG: TetR/AcrR family transcriptional regulator [Cytophagales bacterium]
MPKIDHDTKERILAAAEKVFHANGFKGTRTTLIADQAGISRTMLHYYYSTKEELFQEVMRQTLSAVFMHMSQLMTENTTLANLLTHLIDTVSDLFEAKPGLPSFVVNILNETPDVVTLMTSSTQDNLPAQLEALLAQEKVKGTVAPHISGENLMMDIYSLCSIPYLGAAYIKAKENRTDEQLKAFVAQRREHVKAMILKTIQV